jgi:type II secretory pathway pseudopilin PulG
MERIKLKSASMIEVTVAMVLILLVSTVALIIFITVTTTGASLRKTRHRLHLKELSIKTKKDKSFTDETIEYDEVTVEKKVTPYKGNIKLLHLSLIATEENGKVVCKHQELIYLHEKN